MRILSKKKVNFVTTLITFYHGHLGNLNFIISYHPCHYLCIHDILFHAHAYRITQKNHPLGVRGQRGESGGTTAGNS